MSPASSKLRQKTKQALRKKPYMRCYHLPKLIHTPPATKQPHRRQQRPKTSQTRTTQSQGRLIVSNIRLDQPDLPLLFLWLTTEGIGAGGSVTMLTRQAAAWNHG